MTTHGDSNDHGEREQFIALRYLGKNFIEASYGEQELIVMFLSQEDRLKRVDEFLEALK